MSKIEHKLKMKRILSNYIVTSIELVYRKTGRLQITSNDNRVDIWDISKNLCIDREMTIECNNSL